MITETNYDEYNLITKEIQSIEKIIEENKKQKIRILDIYKKFLEEVK